MGNVVDMRVEEYCVEGVVQCCPRKREWVVGIIKWLNVDQVQYGSFCCFNFFLDWKELECFGSIIISRRMLAWK